MKHDAPGIQDNGPEDVLVFDDVPTTDELSHTFGGNEEPPVYKDSVKEKTDLPSSCSSSPLSNPRNHRRLQEVVPDIGRRRMERRCCRRVICSDRRRRRGRSWEIWKEESASQPTEAILSSPWPKYFRNEEYNPKMEKNKTMEVVENESKEEIPGNGYIEEPLDVDRQLPELFQEARIPIPGCLHEARCSGDPRQRTWRCPRHRNSPQLKEAIRSDRRPKSSIWRRPSQRFRRASPRRRSPATDTSKNPSMSTACCSSRSRSKDSDTGSQQTGRCPRRRNSPQPKDAIRTARRPRSSIWRRTSPRFRKSESKEEIPCYGYFEEPLVPDRH